MKKNVLMPKLSDNMESGVLVAWNKEAGQTVEKGQVLFEVEAEKVVIEVESLESGVLEQVLYEEGDQIKVNQTIAVINCDEVGTR